MMRQMDEDNQQLHYYKHEVQKQKEHSKTLGKSMSMFTRKLELREGEISVVRQRAKEQHEENRREVSLFGGVFFLAMCFYCPFDPQSRGLKIYVDDA